MNIRKVVARLNATSQQLGGGRGGIPEFTPQDIAGAIGMVEDVIGREIFCFAWWPDGAKLMRRELHAKIKDLLFDEYSARFRRLSAAKLELHLLSGATHASRMLPKARQELYEAERAIWPRTMDKYDMIADAVIMEICAPRHCPECSGRGLIQCDALTIKCERCSGGGIVGASKAWRAERLAVNESTYRKYWSTVYDWIYPILSKRESDAAKRVCQALGYAQDAAA